MQPAEVIERERAIRYGMKATSYVLHERLLAALDSAAGVNLAVVEKITSDKQVSNNIMYQKNTQIDH